MTDPAEISIFDTVRGIKMPSAQVPNPIRYLPAGMHMLAQTVRGIENRDSDERSNISFGFLTNQFIWLANFSVNFHRFVAHLEIMLKNNWTDEMIVQDRDIQTAVAKHCGEYVKEVIPEILHFRHKFAAHFASTDIRKDDNTATVANCWSIPVSLSANYFIAGGYSWNINGKTAELKPWSLTKEYERLREEGFPYWPPIVAHTSPRKTPSQSTNTH